MAAIRISALEGFGAIISREPANYEMAHVASRFVSPVIARAFLGRAPQFPPDRARHREQVLLREQEPEAGVTAVDPEIRVDRGIHAGLRPLEIARRIASQRLGRHE